MFVLELWWGDLLKINTKQQKTQNHQMQRIAMNYACMHDM